ncbi:MAG: Unknown protein [uncultured Aureispira sp.]|uniref:Uncharacterized protein n=1 Tax=uncultured Aureispira sp. TaxID=1331704 RepID=A0A6S6THL2_9BACT|nr:MAG: Unknown protein [uncultured Aureispira sp.]
MPHLTNLELESFYWGRPYDKAAKKALLEEIKTTNPLAERDWLLKQIELLS